MTLDLSQVPTDFVFDALKERVKCLRNEKKRLVLFGAPGCGKGTHSGWLKAEFNLAHISTGDALREAVRSGSELGKKVKSVIDRGDLVSDEIVLAIVREKLEQLPDDCGGFVLDGFPRTLEQARGLDKMLKEINQPLTGAFHFDCSEETLRFRICGRRVHPGSGRTYHIVNCPPKVEGKDDVTGEDLIQRADDNAESLKIRLQAFNDVTLPVLEHYKQQGILFRMNSNLEADVVKKDILFLFALAASDMTK